MSIIWDSLIGDTSQLIQYTATATNNDLYSDSNTVAIVGNVWAGRIYGKDLTAFEIASSGKVAISLNDIHTLDFSRSNYIDVGNYINTIQSTCNYSFQLQANTSALQIQLDTYSNNINVTAASNISIKAGSGNINLTASNNFQTEVQSNINLNASKGAATISAHNSNMYLTMTDSSNTFILYSSNSMFVSACNYLNINTNSNISIGSLGGDFKAYADSFNMYITMETLTDNVTLYTLSNMFISASNNYNLNAQSNINVGAFGGDVKIYSQKSNMYLTMTAATNNIDFFASNNLIVTASNSSTFNSLSNIALFASNTIAITASNNFTLNTNSNLNISTLAGDYNIYANSSNMFLTMNCVTNNTTLFTSNNMFINSSNNLDIKVNSNVTFNTLSGNMNVFAKNNLTLSADSSNMYINMNAVGDSIFGYSLSNINFGASNNMFLDASSNINITMSNMNILAHHDISILASNNITISGSNGLFINFATINLSASNDQQFTAQSNIEFFISSASNNPSSPVFTVKGNQVLIRGDMVITGDITTSNVFSTTVIQESLKVADTTIVLASTGSNFSPTDGPFDSPSVNSGAGIKIDGVPSYFDSNILGAYDKTLRWDHGSGTGINQLGTLAGLSNEPTWIFQGGALQLTHQKIVASGGSNIIQDVSFKFRIGDLGELEVVKTFWNTNTGSYETRRVARFGRML